MHDAPYSSIGDLPYYLKGLWFDHTGRRCGVVTFGSMGGRGGVVKVVVDEMTAAEFDVFEQLECFFIPDSDDLDRCFDLGMRFDGSLRDQKTRDDREASSSYLLAFVRFSGDARVGRGHTRPGTTRTIPGVNATVQVSIGACFGSFPAIILPCSRATPVHTLTACPRWQISVYR